MKIAPKLFPMHKAVLRSIGIWRISAKHSFVYFIRLLIQVEQFVDMIVMITVYSGRET